jgi:anti-sigma regulatory factor (Ser/Thr protein kinase)
MRLPKRPEAAAQARRTIDGVCCALDDDARHTAHLLVTEVVANAVRHVGGDGDIGLAIDLHADRLHVEVTDSGPGFEYRPRSLDAPLDGGWGLHFLATLSERWGAQGGRVWFDLPLATAA